MTITSSKTTTPRSFILIIQSPPPGNEECVGLEPCVVSERVYITHPKGVSDEYFYFYSGVIMDFKVRIPFNNFELKLLKALNISHSQLRPNG